MPTNAWIGAIAGAVIGAVLWAGISYFTGYEVVYVAWGVGAAVGGLAAKFGSRGTLAGVACAVLALASIFVGKVAAADLVLKRELQTMSAEVFNRAVYDEFLEDAKALAALPSEAAYPQFMIDRAYSDAETASEVTAEEVADFKAFSLPELKPFRGMAPDFETWSVARRQQFVEDAMADVSLMEVVTDDLGLFDILFAVLGVATAFKLGEGLGTAGGSSQRPARRRTTRPPGGGGGGLSVDAPPPPPPPTGGAGDVPVRRRPRPR